MGTAMLMVKMPDGAVRFGNYQTNSDVCFTRLFDSHEGREVAYRYFKETGDLSVFSCPFREGVEGVEVEVFCDYAKGFYWTAKVNKEGTCLVERLTSSGGNEGSFGYFGIESENSWSEESGIPDWVVEYHKSIPLPPITFLLKYGS